MAIEFGYVVNSDTPVRKAVLGMMAVKRMSMLTHATVEQKLTPRAQELAKDLNRYMADSEQVRLYLLLTISKSYRQSGTCRRRKVARTPPWCRGRLRHVLIAQLALDAAHVARREA